MVSDDEGEIALSTFDRIATSNGSGWTSLQRCIVQIGDVR